MKYLSRSGRGILFIKMAASTSKTPKKSYNSDFQEVFSSRVNDIPITKFISKGSGLELVYCEVPGPAISGYIVIGTISLDDFGIAHVLEHLIFLGSEEYPYKGVLDILAQKCMSSGSNAWTDSDHTCYTMETAGERGFCTLIPIYLEHIFFPLLSEKAFITEVHHLTKQGKDGGVVYSEMLAKENAPDYKPLRELARLMYPSNSPYGFESGGKLKALRDESGCNLQAAKDYHKKYYTPKNTRIIVCGKLSLENLFSSLSPIINKLQQKEFPPNQKQKLDNVPEIKTSITQVVEVASENDDEESSVVIGYLGPSLISELEQVTAVRQLLKYLCDSVIGPLEQTFVECEDSLCGSLYYEHDGNGKSSFILIFEGIENLQDQKQIPIKLKETLQDQLKDFDMIRMSGILLQSIQNELCELESKPRDCLGYAGIADFLYGDGSQEMFNLRFNTIQTLTKLLKENNSFWTKLLETMFLENKSITINVKPSTKELKRLTKEGLDCMQENRKKYGQAGLDKMFAKFLEAQKKNQEKVPPEVMKRINYEPETQFDFFQVTRYKNPSWIKGITCDLYFDDIQTNFIYVTVHLDTSSVNPNLRKYLPIFRASFTESPIKLDNGIIIPHNEVVSELGRNILYYDFSYGMGNGSAFEAGSFAHILAISAQIEMDKAYLGFDWIQKLMFNVHWSEDKLEVLIRSMLGSIKDLKRDPKSLVRVLMNDILYKDESNKKCTSFLRQEVFLREQLDKFSQKSPKMIKSLQEIRNEVTKPKNITIHVASGLGKLKEVLTNRNLNLAELLKKIFHEKGGQPVQRLANTPDVQSMSESKIPRTVLLKVPTEESGYILSCYSEGPNKFNHPELPALLLAMQYFSQVQGPFFTIIRGSGYAYDFYMDTCPNEATVKLVFNKCTSLHEAFAGAKQVVETHLQNKTEWLQDYVDSAKSSLIFDEINVQKTPLRLSKYSLRSYYRELPQDYLQNFIASIKSMKISDLIPVTEKYILPLVNEKCHLAIVCPPNKVESTVNGFKSLGYNLEVMEKIDDCFLTKWNF